MAKIENIFDWLDLARSRRTMFAQSLPELQSMISGYYTAMRVHQIDESLPKLTQGHFGVWLREKTGWSLSMGWARAIENEIGPVVDDQFMQFFSFLDEYRSIVPVSITRVELNANNNPTGKRVKRGHDGLMDKPDEIHVINYRPTSFNHLRHWYDDHFIDDWLLMLGDGSHETTIDDLVKWVADEFEVAREQWIIEPSNAT